MSIRFAAFSYHGADRVLELHRGRDRLEYFAIVCPLCGVRSKVDLTHPGRVGIRHPCRNEHNVINSSRDEHLKIYTIYSSPQHEDGAIHKTKEEAEEEEK